MQTHHYLGALPKIGHTVWYVAAYDEQWVALLSFSAAALKCGARDRWIGWDLRHHYDRLHPIANQSRFAILPQHHQRNLASRVLSLCRHRIQADWVARFGYPLLLLETFVDPQRFVGTIYRASNWQYVGDTRGYQRCRRWIQSDGSVAEAGLCPGAAAQCPRLALSPPVEYPLPQRRRANETERRADAIVAWVFPTGPRSTSGSRPAPPAGERAGHRHRGSAVRGTRLQGHRRLGQGVKPGRGFAVGVIKSQGVSRVAQRRHEVGC